MAAQPNLPPASLTVRRVGIDTYRENVAFLHRGCPVYRAEGFQALSKIEIHTNGKRIFAVLNVADDESIVTPGQLGLSEQAFAQLGAEPGQNVRVAHAEPPTSMDAVRRKIAGERLSLDEYRAIARDISDARYSKTEMSAFLVATAQGGLDRDEVLFLTRSMIETGETLSWDEKLVADKHCIGGIPGNRTSMLVVPIVAAHGMLIPKTSSRAITSPSGTADTMEVLARVDLSIDHLHAQVRKERGALAWGGTARLAPVDDILISVERPLVLDSPAQMVASILAKKIAAGASHLLIDIPVGPSAKVRRMTEALALRKLFEYVGTRLGLLLQVVITDGRQPVGRGIGPVLEARDVMQVLECNPAAPSALRQKALRLAGRVLEFDPDVAGGEGFNIARDILDSGRALAKMNAIIDAQGRQRSPPAPGRLVIEVTATRPGVVTGVDNQQLARIARLAGAPIDKGAGVDVFRRLGEPVQRGEALYRIHADFPADFEFARTAAARAPGFTIGEPEDVPNVFVEF